MALLIGSLTVFAITATTYQAARMPGLDPLASFDEYGVAGISAISRGLAAFGVTVLAWVLIGRRIVALLVSLLLAWLLLWGTTEAFPYGAATEWLTEADAVGSYLRGDIGLEVAWRDGDGTVISYTLRSRISRRTPAGTTGRGCTTGRCRRTWRATASRRSKRVRRSSWAARR